MAPMISERYRSILVTGAPSSLLGDSCHLRCQHDEAFSLDFENGHQRLQSLALHRGLGAEGYYDPGFQVTEQVILNVQQKGNGGNCLGIFVSVNRKLGHQKPRRPALNTPFRPTSSL